MQIDIRNLSFAYGHKTILSNLSLKIDSGDYLVVNGKNGSGKSTLIKCLLGINKINSGMVYFDELDINNFKEWTKFGYVSQLFEDFNYEFPLTVHELLSFSSLNKANDKKILELLDHMGILEIGNQNINSLSGGQLQRVFIVRALLNSPEVLIMDEPTASIDKQNREFFYKTVDRLNSEGKTIILITHNENIEVVNYTHVLTLTTDMTFDFAAREIEEEKI